MGIIISAVLFLVIILIAVGAYVFLKQNSESKRVREQLKTLSTQTYEKMVVDITRKTRPLSNIPWLHRILSDIPLLKKIDHILQQSNLKYPLGIFLLTSLAMAFFGFLATSYTIKSNLVSLLAALVASAIPFLYISFKKNMRIKKFEQQLPEALDLIARSLRAGHAFSGGIQMVAQEFDDPVGSEFAKVLHEINFGVGMKEALINLTERIDCNDLKFFAISVTIQRETGGDLAEILENISYLIRERFKLQDRIRTLSAEGKLSAVILIAIPIFVAFALSIVSPNYIKNLITDPLGKMLVAFSLFTTFMGIIVMKKIITIKV